MNIHSILVFLHVLGAVGIFAAFGIEAAATNALRRARTAAGVRAVMPLFALPRRIGPIAMITLLVSGVWLSAKWWGMQPWIICGLLVTLSMAVLGGVVTRRAMQRIGGALANETGAELSSTFRSLVSSRAPALSLWLRLAMVVGIVALMTLKPGTPGSLLTLAVAVVVGLVGGMRAGGTRRITDEHALNLKEAQS